MGTATQPSAETDERTLRIRVREADADARFAEDATYSGLAIVVALAAVAISVASASAATIPGLIGVAVVIGVIGAARVSRKTKIAAAVDVQMELDKLLATKVAPVTSQSTPAITVAVELTV